MGIADVKRIFEERVSEARMLKNKIRTEQHEKLRLEHEIYHFERIVKSLETKLKHASARISALREKDLNTEKQLKKHKEEISRILSEIDQVRKALV